MNAPEAIAHEPSILVPLDFIAESPTNPRTDFPAAEMAELTDSIRRIGLIQPILLRPWPEKYPHPGANPPKFELVAGARRFRATRDAEIMRMMLLHGMVDVIDGANSSKLWAERNEDDQTIIAIAEALL